MAENQNKKTNKGVLPYNYEIETTRVFNKKLGNTSFDKLKQKSFISLTNIVKKLLNKILS